MADPIKKNLAEGFHDAVARFFDWTASVPEFEVSIDRKPFAMSAVCDFVAGFTDDLPDPVLDRLFSYMDFTSNDLKQRLAVDRTYGTGAYCLRELIKRRKEYYQRLEEARRNR